MNSTHGEILTDADGRPIAFIDGVPDKCQHDTDGPGLMFNDNGRYWPDIALPKSEKAQRRFFKSRGICGGTASCSKCGKPFTPDLFMFD